MPSSEIKPSLFHLSDKKLGELKQYWKVSMQAILYRAFDLGTLTRDQYRRWITKFNYYSWRIKEPLEFEVSSPIILKKMIKLHLEDLEFSKKELLEMFGLNIFKFDKIYLESFDELQKFKESESKVKRLKLEYC